MSMLIRKKGEYLGSYSPYWCFYELNDYPKNEYTYFDNWASKQHTCIDTLGHTFVLFGGSNWNTDEQIARVYNRDLSQYPTTIRVQGGKYSAMYYDADDGSIYIYNVPPVYPCTTLFVTACSIDEYHNAIPMSTVPIMNSIDEDFTPGIFVTKSGSITWVLLVDSVDEARGIEEWARTYWVMLAKSTDHVNWQITDTIPELMLNDNWDGNGWFAFGPDPNTVGNVVAIHYPANRLTDYVGTPFETTGSFIVHKFDPSFNIIRETIPWVHGLQSGYWGNYPTDMACQISGSTLHMAWKSSISNVRYLNYGYYDGTWSPQSTLCTTGTVNQFALHIHDNSVNIFDLNSNQNATIAHYRVSLNSINVDSITWTSSYIKLNGTGFYNVSGHSEFEALPVESQRLGFLIYGGGDWWNERTYLATPCYDNIDTPEEDEGYWSAHSYVNKTLPIKFTNSGHTFNIGSWLSPWNYRKAHIINPSSGAGSDYQVKVVCRYTIGAEDIGGTVHLNNKCKTDFSDVRFTDQTGTFQLGHWCETYNTSGEATFWVKINENLDSESRYMVVYYGNSGASSASDGTQTFILYDNFDDDTEWTWETNDNEFFNAGPNYHHSCDTLHFRSPQTAYDLTNRDDSYYDYWVWTHIKRDFTFPTGITNVRIGVYAYIKNWALEYYWYDRIFINNSLAINVDNYNWYQTYGSSWVKHENNDIVIADGSTTGITLELYLDGVAYWYHNGVHYEDFYIAKSTTIEPNHGDWGIEETIPP